jgi:hypothetical protein
MVGLWLLPLLHSLHLPAMLTSGCTTYSAPLMFGHT